MNRQMIDSKRKKKLTVSSIDRSARALLRSGELHITLVFAFLIAVTTAVIPVFVGSLLSVVLPERLADAFLIAFELLVTMPTFFGLIQIPVQHLTDSGRAGNLFTMFGAFSQIKRYGNTLVAGGIAWLTALLPCATGAGAFLGVRFVLSRFVPFLPKKAETVMAVLAGMVSFLLLLWLSRRLFLVGYYVCQGAAVGRAIGLSCRATRGHTGMLCALYVPLLLLTAVSAALLMLPLILWTAPYLSCVYAVVCDRIECAQNKKLASKERQSVPNETETTIASSTK